MSKNVDENKLDEEKVLHDHSKSETKDKVAQDVKPMTSSENREKESENHEEEQKEVNAFDILYPKEKYKYYLNKELCKESDADGSNVFVKRAGKLVRLTSVFSKNKENLVKEHRETVELVYVYDNGRLLTLAGSMTKINPSNSSAVRARVVLPKGVTHPKKEKSDRKVELKKIKTVEINEDMAKFALSALQTPQEQPQTSQETEKEKLVPKPEMKLIAKAPLSQYKIQNKPSPLSKKNLPPEKPTKNNILDIISAKLAMSDENECTDNDNLTNVNKKSGEINPKETLTSWTDMKNVESNLKNLGGIQSPINGSNGDKDEQQLQGSQENALDKPKIFKKNIYRFPSLSREMKRLNMNFVHFDKPKVKIVIISLFLF